MEALSREEDKCPKGLVQLLCHVHCLATKSAITDASGCLSRCQCKGDECVKKWCIDTFLTARPVPHLACLSTLEGCGSRYTPTWLTLPGRQRSQCHDHHAPNIECMQERLGLLEVRVATARLKRDEET